MKLKQTPKKDIKQLYQMFYDTIKILEHNNIVYWATAGTFLGAVRHKGIMPHDDDIDLGIIESDEGKLKAIKDEFEKCGYTIVKVWLGYKIFYMKNKPKDDLTYSYPFIDIFIYKKFGNRYIFKSKKVIQTWPKEYYKSDELFPLKSYKFGIFNIKAPRNYKDTLSRFYGKDWNTVMYREYDHSNEEEVETVKLKIKPSDRVPAQPTKINLNNKCLKSLVLKPDSLVRKKSKSSEICNKNVFDQENMGVYLINCDSSTKRLEKAKKELSKQNISFCRESCVNGRKYITNAMICKMKEEKFITKSNNMTPVEIAINLSHLNVWIRSLENKEDYALVFEDDFKLRKNFVKNIKDILADLNEKDIDFSIFHLYNGNWMKTKSKLKHITKVNGIDIYQETVGYNAGCVAYIISKEFMRKLCSVYFPIREPQDMLIGELYKFGKHLTIKCKRDKELDCEIGQDLLYTGCGGEGGTGKDSTQMSDEINAKNMCKI